MKEELEELLRNVATIAYEKVKHHSFSDRVFEHAMSEELTEREINHETHKKVFDERKGKYRFIDLWLPDHKSFAKIKSRKFITRTEINELKDEEQLLKMEGIIINFHNGVTFRNTNGTRDRDTEFDPLASLPMPPEHHRHSKTRMTLPQLSGSTGRLSDFGDHSFRNGRFHYRSPLSALPLNGERDSFNNTNKIFAISCAAFFLAEGDRKTFASTFNDMLEAMKFDKIDIPNKFLDGPKLKTPDGELAEVFQKAFAERRRSKSFKKDSKSTSRSSTNQSGDEQDPELHYVGFNDSQNR